MSGQMEQDNLSGRIARRFAALALNLSPVEKADQSAAAAGRASCFHCGEPCPDGRFAKEEKLFCCVGCLTVHDLLAGSGLSQFYQMQAHPGVRITQNATKAQARWKFLDDPHVQQRLLDFTDGKTSRITLKIPAIHCAACVWLLENVHRLHRAIGKAQVNFPRRELAICFSPHLSTLSELAALLASIGYEPQFTLDELENRTSDSDPTSKVRWLQLGMAGFAFGNIMLFSLPVYLGLDSLSGPLFKALFGYISLALAAPVVTFSASDYWRSASLSLRQKALTLDVPIAIGLGAIYLQSAWEIISGHGAGYLDSLCGLVFFLLCGRAFQRKTFERMAFDRDYKCFFPLAVTRKTATGEESVSISQLRVGDSLVLRHGELIPADSRLRAGAGLIDYSFVTGESEPTERKAGDHLYAGGRQIAASIEIETVKAVSQSYLASLWNHEAFKKERENNLNTLTNRYSRRFTRVVILVALCAALFWVVFGDAARGMKAFVSVLIVACPCALALAAPFALGTAQRRLARSGVFLKNGLVCERMAQVDAIVFDKTGTLTTAQAEGVRFVPAASEQLSSEELGWVRALARHSTHPHSIRICDALETMQSAGMHHAPNASRGTIRPQNREAFGVRGIPALPIASSQNGVEQATRFEETPGCGIEGRVAAHQLRIGSRAWLGACAVFVPAFDSPPGSLVCVAIDGAFRGAFVLGNTLRPETSRLLSRLADSHEIALLSGDNEREREAFQPLFGCHSRLHFNQNPLDKLGFIRSLQAQGKTVMMVGDGLNDAGALRQSDVGIAVVEKMDAFSPACDVILSAAQVGKLPEALALSRSTVNIVRWSFGVSALYNLLGIAIAASGRLSPVICAILMPLSSFTVVLFACGAVQWTRGEGRGLSGEGNNIQHPPSPATQHATRNTQHAPSPFTHHVSRLSSHVSRFT